MYIVLEDSYNSLARQWRFAILWLCVHGIFSESLAYVDESLWAAKKNILNKMFSVQEDEIDEVSDSLKKNVIQQPVKILILVP